MIAVDAINAPKDFMQSKAVISTAVTVDVARLADARLQLKDCANAD